MSYHKMFKLASALLLIILFTTACKGQTGDTKTNKETDPQAAAIQVPGELPDSTNLEVAKASRAPRNITIGYYIIVDKSSHILSLYKDGKLFKSYPVGTGKTIGDKVKVEDSATPEGYFNVKAIRESQNWEHTFPGDKVPTKNVYGPYFISLNTDRPQTFTGEGWSGIGIHGTHDPSSIGKNVSAGCIRMNNADVIAVKNEIAKAADLSQVQVDILP